MPEPVNGPTRRWDLAALVVVAVGFFAPQLRPAAFPVLDAASLFQQFHYFYSGYYFGDGIPQWYPYGFFGVQTDVLRLGYLTPAFYAAIVFGSLFHVQNVLLLFKVALLAEHLMLLTGTYLLSGELFSGRATRFMLCISVVGGTVWYAAPFFNFRIYYLLPLLLVLLIRFLRTGRVLWMLGAGLTGFGWLLGNAGYLAPLWIFVLFVGNVVLVRDWIAVVPALKRQALAVCGSIAVLAFLAGCYGYAIRETTAHVAMSAPGRNAAGGTVDLGTFLTYGGHLDRRALPRVIALGSPTHLANGSGRDVSVYSGLPILLFFAGAFLLVRDPVFAALCTMSLTLVLLSFGGGIAHAVYYFPGMKYYRHIAHIYGLVKVLLLLCAGYGMERFWRSRPSLQVASMTLAGLSFLGLSLVLHEPVIGARVAGYAAALGTGFLVARLLATRRPGAGDRAGRWVVQGVQWGLALGFVVDLASFQRTVFSEASPTVSAGQEWMLESTRVRPLEWQAVRTSQPVTPAARAAWALATRPEALVNYAFAYNFAGFDACVSEVRVDLMAAGMAQLTSRLTPRSPAWNRIMGCDNGKLRVFTGTPVIEGHVAEFGGDTEEVTGATPRVVSFGPNHITVEVNARTAESWLVYADGYHPGWRARVNGGVSTVFAALGATKAVPLVPGPNTVELVFRRPVSDAITHLFTAYGVLFSLAVLFVLIRTVGKEAAGGC